MHYALNVANLEVVGNAGALKSPRAAGLVSVVIGNENQVTPPYDVYFVPTLPVSGFLLPLVDQLLSLVSSLVERSCPLTTVPSFFV